MNITIAAIPDSFLHRVRSEGIDDQGQAVKRVRASGGEPVRDVLRRVEPGEELILGSFTPFAKSGPYKEFGPIFVLANPSDETTRRDALPDAYFNERFVIRAYSHDEAILDAAMVTKPEAQETIDRFLTRPDVAFLHARFPTYGCFACRIDRVSS